MALTLEPYLDQVDGFGLLLPAEWERVDPPADEVRLVALEPLAAQGFRSNVVVTVDVLPEGLSLGEWQDGNDQMMPTMLDGWLLLDRFTERRVSNPLGPADPMEPVIAVRRLGHHIGQGGVPVTMRQVALVVDGRGLTLTTSMWTPAYPHQLPVIERIERSFSHGSLEEEGSRGEG